MQIYHLYMKTSTLFICSIDGTFSSPTPTSSVCCEEPDKASVSVSPARVFFFLSRSWKPYRIHFNRKLPPIPLFKEPVQNWHFSRRRTTLCWGLLVGFKYLVLTLEEWCASISSNNHDGKYGRKHPWSLLPYTCPNWSSLLSVDYIWKPSFTHTHTHNDDCDFRIYRTALTKWYRWCVILTRA